MVQIQRIIDMIATRVNMKVLLKKGSDSNTQTVFELY